MAHHFDIVIIGSGAGGGTMARALAGTSARVLVVERGDFVPQEAENWDPRSVWVDRRYQASEQWLGERPWGILPGRPFRPYTHYCVGGNTKFWGSALFRLRREDFGEMRHLDGLSPAWPIDYDTLAPFYRRAEELYAVRGLAGVDPTEPAREPFPHGPVPHSVGMDGIASTLRELGLHPFPLPLGLLRVAEEGGCRLCATCNSFPCRIHAKSEADVVCVRPAQDLGVTLWRNALARRLLTDASGRRVVAVEIERQGETVRVEADLVVAACGAVNSAALLLRSANDRHPHGLANSSGLVGRRYMAHQATFISAWHPRQKNATEFQKTLAINDYYFRGAGANFPLGQIQSQGRTDPVTLKGGGPWYIRGVPLTWFEQWTSRAVDWLAMSEDLPDPRNRVTVTANGQIRLRYRPNNVRAHRVLVAETKRVLKQAGFWLIVKHSHGAKNTTHQCGTLVFGADPATSVLDPFCRAHDVENLFVVDASFFPSSAAVNPGLTIIAQALRVADHIKELELGMVPAAEPCEVEA